MITLTEQKLRSICPQAPSDVVKYISPLNAVMTQFSINQSLKRAAFFLAQCAHECDQFRAVIEYSSGAQYEGSKILGNTVKGDGKRYKGRGILQCTGRYNYQTLGAAMKLDLINNPALLETPTNACFAGAWKFNQIKGNSIAELPDTWRTKDNPVGLNPFQYLTYRINGGQSHYDERLAFLNIALKVLAT